MSGKRPKGSFHACRESMAAADSHATTKNGQGLERFTPCPELNEEVSNYLDECEAFMKGYPVHQVTEDD